MKYKLKVGGDVEIYNNYNELVLNEKRDDVVSFCKNFLNEVE